MENPLLPYLSCLRTTLGTIAAALQADPALGMPSAIGARLVDRMAIDQTLVPQLRRQRYAALLDLLPALEAELVATEYGTTLRELRVLCETADPAVYARCQELSGDLQRGLLVQQSASAAALAKRMWRIETDYCRALEDGVEARAVAQAQAAAGSDALAARNSRRIDEVALLDFLRATFPEENALRIVRTQFVSGGYSKFTASIALDNAKSLPAQIILRGDGSATYGGASVTHEYGLIKAVYDSGVCVPRPLALESSGKVFGSPFLLVEKRPGSAMGNMFFLPEPNPARGRDIAKKLASIHRVPLAAVGDIDGANMPSSEKALAWIDEAQRNWLPLDMPSPVFEIAFDWLRRNAHINDRGPRTLVHGDFATHNLLFEGDEVSTILDWEFAHVGCPAYDLGYFYYMGKALGDWQEFLDAYGGAGMPVPDDAQINYNILLASTRLGVMVCQSTSLFTSGKEAGAALAVNLSSCLYEVTIRRMSEILERVL